MNMPTTVIMNKRTLYYQKVVNLPLFVTPLHASYGQIGYTIHFPYSRDPMPEIAYDWEMNDLTIDEEDWQKWLAPGDEEDCEDDGTSEE